MVCDELCFNPNRCSALHVKDDQRRDRLMYAIARRSGTIQDHGVRQMYSGSRILIAEIKSHTRRAISSSDLTQCPH